MTTKKKTESEPVSEPVSNMDLWNRLCRTDPRHTKKVSRGGGRTFTAIDAHYQVQRATEEWGPCGGNWGFDFDWMEHPVLWIARVTLWYLDKSASRCNISHVGTARRDNKWGVDDDAPKKAITDGLTKCMSYTGLSADVFLGLYDDNKYVAELREEFGLNPNAEPIQPGKPSRDERAASMPTNVRAAKKETIKRTCQALCGDKDWYEYLQSLAADLGFPMDVDAMNNEQFDHIVAELEAMDSQRRTDLHGTQSTLGLPDGPPLSVYDDDDDIRF